MELSESHGSLTDRSIEQHPVLISVVVPVLDELETIDVLLERVSSTLQRVTPPVDHEIIFVDDGSTDGSRERLRNLALERESVHVVEMSRNFGHQMAITAGIDHSAGDAVVVMDGDLQDPPEIVSRMIEMWRDGADVVYGVRRSRDGESRVKKAAASAHYRLLRWLSDTDIPVDTGDFRLMSRRVVDALRSMRESSRYLRGMVAWLGFEQRALEFKRDPRHAGRAKYTYRTLLRLSIDGLTSFTEKPLRLTSQLGIVVTVLAGLYGLWIIMAKLIDPSRAPGGFAAIMTTVLVLGGIQLFAIGLVGQYLGRVYRETKGRPLYVVSRRTGWNRAGQTERRSKPGSESGMGMKGLDVHQVSGS